MDIFKHIFYCCICDILMNTRFVYPYILIVLALRNIHFEVPPRLISDGGREIREILDDIEGIPEKYWTTIPEKYWAGKHKYILGRNKSLGSEWEI